MLQCYLWPVDLSRKGRPLPFCSDVDWLEEVKIALRQKPKDGGGLSRPDFNSLLRPDNENLEFKAQMSWMCQVAPPCVSRQLGETLERVEGSLVASSSKKSRNFFNVPLYIIYFGGSHTILMQVRGYSILFYCVSLTVALCSQPGQSKLGWTGQVISIL